MELVCLVKTDQGKQGWQERLVKLEQGKIIICSVKSWTEKLRLEPGCYFYIPEDSGTQVKVAAWPKIGGKRRKVELIFESEDASSFEKLKAHIKTTGTMQKQRKKVLVFVNPFAGTKKATQVWNNVRDIIKHANVDCEVVLTERANHARDMVKDVNLEKYSGVVSVSGDGLLHEVLNGLYARPDWENIRENFPIGVAPGGSGNAVHCSLMFQLGEHFSDEVTIAGMNIANGFSQQADYIECETQERKFLSIFGIAWGFIPEADLGSEVIRWMGPNRAYLWVGWRVLFPITYEGKIEYLEATGDPKIDSIPVELPNIKDPLPEDWKTESGEFFNVYVCKQSWLDYNCMLVPDCKLDDGMLWLVIIKAPVSRMEMVSWLLSLDTAGHLQMNQTKMVKIRAFRLTPDTPYCPMTVDAERFDDRLIQGRIKPRGCRIMTKQPL